MNTEQNCAACRDALPGYVAGTLTSAARAAVERHLADCAACQRALAQWRSLAQMAQQADAQVPRGSAQAAATWAAIQAQLLSESPIATGKTNMNSEQNEQHTDPVARPLTSSSRPERHQPRRTPLFAMAAVVALVALTAGIFALRPHTGKPTPGTGLHPTAAPAQPSSTPDTSPPALTYFAGDIRAANDIWAVGNSPIGAFSAIAHFDGHAWQASPGGNFPNTNLYGISMDSATDGWAVGNFQSPNISPLLAHYANGHWVQTPLNAPNVGLIQVQMFSADDGWALGSDTNNQSVFFHFAQGKWTKVPFAPSASSAGAAFTASAFAPQSAHLPASAISPNIANISRMQMLSDTEGWAVGTFHKQNLVWHDHNGQWTAAHQFSSGGAILGLGVNDANDVWIIGITGPLGQAAQSTTFGSHAAFSFGPPLLQHFNGQNWTDVPIDVWGNSPFLDGAHWLTRYGQQNNQQVMQGLFHNQGGKWVATSFPHPVTAIFNAASQPDGSTLALAVTGDPGGAQTPEILRYANGVWTVVNS